MPAMRIVGMLVSVLAGLMIFVCSVAVFVESAYLLKIVHVGLVLVAMGMIRIDQARRQHDALIAAIADARRPQADHVARSERTTQSATPRPKRIDELLEQDGH